jgi:hypothetical protein
LNKRILFAFIIVILAGLMASLYFVWSLTNYSSSSNSFIVSGTVEQGVEPGCVILRADDGTQYLLLGLPSYPPYGDSVDVTGYVANSVASYCMQGEAAIHVVSISVSAHSTTQFLSDGTQTAYNATIIGFSTQQSTTITGLPITISGYVYVTVESPQCYPACGAPSFILIYLYVPPGAGCTDASGCYPPPQYYRLLNADGSPFWPTEPNGTYTTVSGILVTPSSWSCNSFYVPRICPIGDVYVRA